MIQVSRRGLLTAAAVVIAIALLQHRRGAFFKFFDADGQRTNNVFADRFETLHFGHGRVRRVDIEKREMGFTVLFDPESQRLDAPIFGFRDFAAIGFNHAFIMLIDGLDLLRRHILAHEDDMLVKSHGFTFPVSRELSAPSPSSH